MVLVPGEGVLCLEIKAGNASRSEGVWRYGAGPSIQTSSVGPFRQAADAMHAIRKHLAKVQPDFAKLMFFSAVIFTHIDFDEQSPEWHEWQWANRTDLARQPISAVCLRILRRAHDHVRSTASTGWYSTQTSRPTPEQVLRLAEILRKDFEYFVSPQVRIAHVEQQIMRFTQEQFRGLDALQENNRIVFKGPAGTGKTLLALEAANRSVKAGKRTLLACYNRLLGEWLSQQMDAVARTNLQLLTVGTFHAILLRYSGTSPTDSESHEFWTRELPHQVLERIFSDQLDSPKFDAVIIDEAQDLLTEHYLDILEMLLEGGLAGGKWAFFGDFERQAIYAEGRTRSPDDLLDCLQRRAPHHTICALRTNCRNSENIAIGVELACRLEPGYGAILNPEHESKLEVHFYRDAEDQLNLLTRVLSDIRRQFSSSQITILSMKDDRTSCAAKLGISDRNARIHPIRSRAQQADSVPYTTIHAFKGLEAAAVILTDIDEFGGARMEALLYIGMTRARMHLRILMHESCRRRYEQAVREGFQNLGTNRRIHGQS